MLLTVDEYEEYEAWRYSKDRSAPKAHAMSPDRVAIEAALDELSGLIWGERWHDDMESALLPFMTKPATTRREAKAFQRDLEALLDFQRRGHGGCHASHRDAAYSCLRSWGLAGLLDVAGGGHAPVGGIMSASSNRAPMMNRTFSGASEIVDVGASKNFGGGSWLVPVPMGRAGEKRRWRDDVWSELSEDADFDEEPFPIRLT